MLTMAPSLLMASDSFGLRSFNQTFDDVSPLETTIPADARDGDLLVIFASFRASNREDLPAGWTQAFLDGESDTHGFILWKVAGPSDAGTTVQYGSTGTDSSAIVTVWKNAAFSIVGTFVHKNDDSDTTVPAITTLNDGDIVCVAVSSQAAEFSLSLSTSGFDVISSEASVAGFGQTAGMFQREQAVAGSTGTVDVAIGSSTDTFGIQFSLTRA